MNPEEVEQRISEYRKANVSEAALAVIRERLSGTPPVASSKAPRKWSPLEAQIVGEPAHDTAAVNGYADLVAQQADAMRLDEAGSMGGIQSVKNAIGAFGGAAIDTGTLGYGPKLVGGESGQAAIQAAREVHPVAGLAGDLTGAIASPLTKGLGKIGTGIVGAAGRLGSVVAPKWAASVAATDSILARGAVASVKNIAAGAIAGAGFAGLETNPEDRSRIDKMKAAALSPENAILGTAIGGFAAKLYRRPGANAQAMRPMIEKFERVTGQKVPVAVYTDNALLQRQMDSMARIPDLADDVGRLRRTTFDGMRALGKSIADDLNAGTDTPDVAAAKVRELAGKPVGKRPERGAFSKRREAIQGGFFDTHGKETATEQTTDMLGLVYKDVVASRTPVDKTGDASPFTALFGPILKAHKNPITLNHLEAIRKELSRVGFSFNAANPNDAAWGERGAYEARRMYGSVVEAMNQITPTFKKVNSIAEKLHRLEDAVKDIPSTTMDDKVMASMWTAPNLGVVWKQIIRGGDAADIGTLRGDYFHRLLEELKDKDGLISPARVRQVISDSPGMFNRQTVKEIVPGAREAIDDYARLSEAVRKTFPPEGSQTAGRLAHYTNNALAAAQIGSFVVGLFTNPYSGVATALGVHGLKRVFEAQARSMINGHLADAMQRLARGGTPQTVAMPGLAAQAAGGVPAAISAGTSAISPVAGVVGGVAAPAASTIFTPVKERGRQ